MKRSDSRLGSARRPWSPMASGLALLALGLSGAIGSGVPGASQAPAPPTSARERNEAARKWFQDAKLGLFVHWGVYSLLGKGEWVMDRDKLPIREYGKLPGLFDPSHFEADAWVKLARGAGARYITVTAKHHDGFCMFDSKLTDYDVVDATKSHADPLKALADACRQQGIKLFFYYSLLDWHHPDYFPLGKTGRSAGREGRGDWKRYVAYYQGQVRELCTHYGEIGGIWFDGMWDRPDAEWDLAATYRMIHELQPGGLVGNNHHDDPMADEDFQMFEQDLPGQNAAGFNRAEVALNLPLETCLTINDSWGYNAADTHYKTSDQLIRALVGAAGRGANLLVNVGPRPDGTIVPEQGQRLLELGKWLAVNGPSIYNTRTGPIAPQPWGVSTRSSGFGGGQVYLHILNPDVESPIILKEGAADWSAYLFGKETPVQLRPSAGGTALEVPRDARSPVDTIVVLRSTVIGR
jgi:alpha-L-fucosidase